MPVYLKFSRTVAIVLALAAGPAWAHHSFAMFDLTKNQTISGVIKDLDWTNPHSWLDVVATDSTGKAVTWGFEAGSPSTLYKAGWRVSAIHAGDKISVTFHPLRDGGPGGSLLGATLADGTVLAAMARRP